MNAMFDTVVRHDAAFDVLEFRIGRTNDEPSFVSMRVTAKSPAALTEVLEELVALGCRVARAEDAHLVSADRDGCAPEDFYSTTNHQTSVRLDGQWMPVDRQRMDAAIVDRGRPRRLPQAARDPRGRRGRLRHPRHQDRAGVPGARSARLRVHDQRNFVRAPGRGRRVADRGDDARRQAGRRSIAFVAGPVVVHTGGGAYFCDLVRHGYVDVLLAGNALAVHDVEQALYGTSLGVDMESGRAIEGGHRHHMRAINAIFRAGGLRPAVDSGVLTVGRDVQVHSPQRALRPCRKHPRRWSAAGHGDEPGRGAGPLYRRAAGREAGARAVHDAARHRRRQHAAAWVRLVCVDINPAVVTKLADRGSSQTIGIVTDVGLFLRQFASALHAPEFSPRCSADLQVRRSRAGLKACTTSE